MLIKQALLSPLIVVGALAATAAPFEDCATLHKMVQDTLAHVEQLSQNIVSFSAVDELMARLGTKPLLVDPRSSCPQAHQDYVELVKKFDEQARRFIAWQTRAQQVFERATKLHDELRPLLPVAMSQLLDDAARTKIDTFLKKLSQEVPSLHEDLQWLARQKVQFGSQQLAPLSLDQVRKATALVAELDKVPTVVGLEANIQRAMHDLLERFKSMQGAVVNIEQVEPERSTAKKRLIREAAEKFAELRRLESLVKPHLARVATTEFLPADKDILTNISSHVAALGKRLRDQYAYPYDALRVDDIVAIASQVVPDGTPAVRDQIVALIGALRRKPAAELNQAAIDVINRLGPSVSEGVWSFDRITQEMRAIEQRVKDQPLDQQKLLLDAFWATARAQYLTMYDLALKDNALQLGQALRDLQGMYPESLRHARIDRIPGENPA